MILFIENDNFLKNVDELVQYVFDEEKLITILGEEHDNTFNCKNKDKEISIIEYIRNVCDNDFNNCKILLEYNELNNPTNIGSVNLNNAYDEFSDNDNIKIIAIDIRNSYLGNRKQNLLYCSKNEIYSFSKEKIKTEFVDIFFKNNYLDVEFIRTNNVLNQKYIEIRDMFIRLRQDCIKENVDIVRMVLKIKFAWSYLVDLNILIEIYKNDYNNLICIIGKTHIYNLEKMFKGVHNLHLIAKKHKNDDCINTFETFFISKV